MELYFSQGVVEGELIYTVDNMTGMVVEYNMSTKKAEYIPCVISEIYEQRDAVFSIKKYNHFLYLILTGGKYLMELDLINCEYEKYEIDCGVDSWGNFSAVECHNANIYLFARKKNKILIFNCETKKTWEQEYNLEECYVAGRWKNQLFLFSDLHNAVFEYDLEENGFVKSLQLPENMRVADCQCTTEGMFLLSEEGGVYQWCPNQDMILITKNGKASSFGKMIVLKNWIYIFPSVKEDIVKISRDGKTEMILTDYPQDFTYNDISAWSKFSGIYENENTFFIFPRRANYMLKIDRGMEEIEWEKIEKPMEKERIGLLIEKEASIINEEKGSLKAFLDIMTGA